MMFRKKILASVISSAFVLSTSQLSHAIDSGHSADNPKENVPLIIPIEDKPILDKYGYDIYGLIALQLAGRDYHEHSASNNDGVQLNNESRIGWKGFAHFDALPVDTAFVWQIEAGYVDPSFSKQSGSFLGERDTFIGIDGVNFGLVRAGRVLTPLYELVDWPGSNPGLGDVWDWGGSIAGVDFNDRQSDTLRWDTNELWKGFTLNVAVGAGQNRDGETDSSDAGSNYYHGMAGHQKFKYGEGKWVQLDLAYEINYKSKVVDTQDQSDCANLTTTKNTWNNYTYLAGIQGNHSLNKHGSIGYFAQYRHAKAEDQSSNDAAPDQKERGYTAGLMYNFGKDNKWQAKTGYAVLDDVEVKGEADKKTKKHVSSGQLMYSIDSNAIVYARYRSIDDTNSCNSNWKEASTGIEYWF